MTELSPLATHLPWDQHTGENAGEEKPAARPVARAPIGCESVSSMPTAKPVAPGVVGEVACAARNA